MPIACGSAADVEGDRIIVLSPTFEEPGSHECTLVALSDTPPGCVDSILPPTNLVNGAIYSIKLEYQDKGGNPIAEVLHEGIEHDIVSQVPLLNTPSSSQTRFRNDFEILSNDF